MYGGASHRLASFFFYWKLSNNAKIQKDMLIYDICLLLKGKSFGSEFGGGMKSAIDNNK